MSRELAAQNHLLQSEVEQRKQTEVRQQQLVDELSHERSRLQEFTATLESRVEKGTQQIRTLAAQLSLAEHGERKRVSQILHDHVQQMLYGVQMRTHIIGMTLSQDHTPQVRDQLSEMKRLTDEAVRAVRTLAVELSPPVLENEGLPEAITWLGSQMRELHELHVSMKTDGNCQISDIHLRVVVFQIVRELLFNVVKHAHVKEAWVDLDCNGTQISATVRDHGLGFDKENIPTKHDIKTGLGLSSIEERLHLFNGALEIKSHQGHGTEIKISLPI